MNNGKLESGHVGLGLALSGATLRARYVYVFAMDSSRIAAFFSLCLSFVDLKEQFMHTHTHTAPITKQITPDDTAFLLRSSFSFFFHLSSAGSSLLERNPFILLCGCFVKK